MSDREQHTDPRTKCQAPPQRIDEQPQIAGVADDTIDAAGDQGVAGLDGDQPAEPTAEHKDWPDPQRATGGEENDAKPANGIPIEGPEPRAVRLGRQIGDQQPDQREGDDDPAVAAILAHPRTQISATEEGYASQHEEAIARAIKADGRRTRPIRQSRGWRARDRQGSLPPW